MVFKTSQMSIWFSQNFDKLAKNLKPVSFQSLKAEIVNVTSTFGKTVHLTSTVSVDCCLTFKDSQNDLSVQCSA